MKIKSSKCNSCHLPIELKLTAGQSSISKQRCFFWHWWWRYQTLASDNPSPASPWSASDDRLYKPSEPSADCRWPPFSSPSSFYQHHQVHTPKGWSLHHCKFEHLISSCCNITMSITAIDTHLITAMWMERTLHVMARKTIFKSRKRWLHGPRPSRRQQFGLLISFILIVFTGRLSILKPSPSQINRCVVSIQ